MTMKTFAAAALAGLLASGPALADLVIPDLSYRTGPYAAGVRRSRMAIRTISIC